ncbi:MAG: Flp pilus assembly complex ATPase component TadA [Armatimonadetes bacterium]|nr:Flp pilus assembly complex ATPase component TadA [Armatimonadota bacterium]
MSGRGLIERLVSSGAAEREVLEKVLDDPSYQDQSLENALLQSGLVSEEALASAISEEHGVPLLEIVPDKIAEEMSGVIPEDMARNYTILPISLEEGVLTLAMVDPVDVVAEDLVRYVTKKEVRRAVATRSQILAGIAALYSDRYAVDNILAKIPKSDIELVSEEDDADAQGDMAESAPVVQLVNTVLGDAIKMRASDIHVEPLEEGLRVRYRIDGLLRNIVQLPRRVQNPVLSRIKLMAQMDIAERRLPQDGRIRVLLKDREVDLRVNTLPGYHGEKIVLRVLDKGGGAIRLEDIGFAPEDLSRIHRLLDSPQGMIVITGPTGSGKTTTLYAALSHVNHVHDNVITVEDPVEFQLDGITQVPIRPKGGMTFARALRAILRQDPDVVMVGEIRDPETAEIALQAAQTGHLVLSTLHTNDAASSVTRLLHMGLPGYLIGSSLLAVVAQRLVRRLCAGCRQETEPSPESLRLLELVLVGRPPARVYAGTGCEDCDFSGFRGRTGLYEVMEITDRLRGLILQNASARTLKKAAREEGMRLMIEDALLKVEAGITDLEEVLRVVQIESVGGRTCARCERPMPEDFLVCPFCDTGTHRFCPRCGKGLEPDWITCPYCRCGLSEPEVPSTGIDATVGGAEVKTVLPVRGDAAASPAERPSAGPDTVRRRREPAPQARPPAAPMKEGDRVLVLEADPMQARILTTVLARHGLSTVVVSDPSEVLELALNQPPRAIVADASLATAEFRLMERLRSQLATSLIPVLLTTRRDGVTGNLIGVEAGADAYVLRPVDPNQLITRLRGLLEQSP